MVPAPDALDPGPIALRVRNVSFDVSETPLHWIRGFPVASNIITAYHMIVPEAERFFILAFEEALPLVKDERLREDIRGFIGQEALHADAHDDAVDDFLARHGIDPDPVLAQVRWLMHRVFGPRDDLNEVERREYLVERLAVVSAIENFTAFLGHFALNNRWDEYDVDQNMADLLRWHGAEEMEHRDVAHDVACYFDDGYLRRVRAMAIVVASFAFLTARVGAYVIRHDPDAPHSLLSVLRDIVDAGRKGVLPTLRDVVGAALTYLKPSYTPADTGSMAQALDFLARVDASQAA